MKLYKILKMFTVDNDRKNTTHGITNEVILQELKEHFKQKLKLESVKYENGEGRMLYPMSFTILMDPEDYQDREQALPLILPVAVKSFYTIMKAMKSEYNEYLPSPAKYWHFQFSPCRMNELEGHGNKDMVYVHKGHITTLSTLMSTFDIRDVNNFTEEKNVRVSIKIDNSDVMSTLNLNRDAIRNIDIVGNGIFNYDFDETLNGEINDISEKSNVSEVMGLAELSYTKDGHRYTFTMRDNLIHISGKNEMRKGRAFFIINNENIKDSHVQIRYVASDKKFQLAAFGTVRLNEKKIPESSGGNIFWQNLANNSSIFINGETSVKFKIK